MRALRREVVEYNFVEKWEEGLDEEVQNENQLEEEETRK